MSADEDLYLNQSEPETLFYPDALLGNADELDFESFGDSSGLDDGTFNRITGPSLTSFETRDIFKSTGLNGDSFADEVEAKCNPNSIEASTNGTHHYMFNKPTLDLESMGMAYGISGLYLQGNGMTTTTTTGLRSPSSPSTMRQSGGLLSPFSEKLNRLTLGQQQQMATPSYAAPGMQPFSSARAMSATTAMTTSPVVTQAVPMTRFGSQEVLMVAAERSQSTSPTLSPNSSDGKEQVERLIVSENEMKLAQEQKQYYSLQTERGVDSTASFVDQVDGDGDGLLPLPQMTRPSMQRSFSSHALGQLRHMGANAAPASENGMSSRPSATIHRSGGLSSPGARPQQPQQPSLAEFQSLGMRPMMRRVYSAGDIQTLNGMQGSLSGSASPSFDDGSYRVGKYSMEERKIRIHRYQQKRTQRNFNKKIKYACRKTLADSRPRVRGRFAKNMDDDIPTAVLGHKREDDDDDEGDAHANGGEANGYHHFDNSLGEYSDMLTRIKMEHRTINSM